MTTDKPTGVIPLSRINVAEAMQEPVKIVQISHGSRDVLLGLGSDGAVYYEAFDDKGQNPHWRLYLCPLSQQPQPTTP
jgi:hypothetical protein